MTFMHLFQNFAAHKLNLKGTLQQLLIIKRKWNHIMDQ